MRTALLALVVAISGCQVEKAQDAPVTAEVVAQYASFGEGVVFESDSVGYFSDVGSGIVHRFSLDGRVTEWARTAQPNGHRILADGTHVIADAEEHAILRFDPAGRRLSPITQSSDSALVAPNDIALDDAGGFYFTDPGTGTVHYVDSAGTATTAARHVDVANGIALHPNGRVLFVSQSRLGPRGGGQVSRFAVNYPGQLGPGEVVATFDEPAPDSTVVTWIDGIAFDREGNLYVTYGGVGHVDVLDAQGAVTRHLDAGQFSVANLAFGGPGLRALYVVGARDQYRGPATAPFRTRLEAVGPGLLTRIRLGTVTGWSDRAGWRAIQ